MAKTVLVVDDEIDLLDIVRIWLTENGYKTILAENGVDALEKLKEGLPNLILLDIAMPGMDGFELLQRIRRNPNTAQMPVVMLTARGDTSAIMESQRLRATDYLTKPVELHDLISTIQRYI